MARISASNANFGFLVMALVLMLHPVVAKLTPKPASHRLLARSIPDQCFLTPLKVQSDGYEKRCGDKSDSKHPCFTHWYGDLKSVDARPFLEPLDIAKAIMIKDDNMLDFTVDDPSKAFVIRYPNAGGVQVAYSNYDPATGCKDITLKRGDNSVWRVWASDETDDDRDVDTKNEEMTKKKLCTKWIHLHIKRDG